MCEIGMTLSEIHNQLKNFRKWAKPHKVKTPLSQFYGTSYEIAEPHGVVLVMSPWNYPFMLTMTPAIGAIAAGNTTSKMLADTQAQCKQMIQEARSTSQAIISSAIKERTLKVDELNNEYRSKRNLLISLSEDFEAFQHHIQKTHTALKTIVDQLPSDMKENSLYHE